MSGLIINTINTNTNNTNVPSRLLLNGFQLPNDVVIYLNGKKVLVMDKILDGVSVTERISRDPYEIELEFTMREKSNDPSSNINLTQYIFPQDALDSLWQRVWIPDTVLSIDNTYLNKLGIQEMIIETITPTTIRGSMNIPVRIRGWENVPGQSLIL